MTNDHGLPAGSFYRALFEQQALGVALLDTATGRFVRINRRYCDITGYSCQEMEALDFQTITHPDDLQPDLDNMARLVAGRTRSFTMEKRYRRKDGQLVWVNLTVSPLWQTGEPALFHLAVVEDITARKLGEMALQESESLIRSLSNNLPNCMLYQIVITPDGRRRFAYVSEAVRRFYGCSPTEAMADPNLIYGRLIEEDRQRLHDEEERAIKALATFTSEARMKRPDGGIRWSYFASGPRLLEDGSTCWDGIEMDITERKAAEAAMRKQSEELTALNALGRDVNATLSFAQTISAGLKGIVNAVRPDIAFLFLRDQDALRLQDVVPDAARQRLGPIPEHKVGECMCGLAVSENKPFYSSDIFKDPRCTWDECKQAGIRSFAALPLRSAEQPFAVIGLASLSPRDFEKQAEFLETLAGQVATSLINARLFETVEQELAERRRTEQALRVSEDNYRVLFEMESDAIFLIDNASGRLLQANSAACALYGYSHTELLSLTNADLSAEPEQTRNVTTQTVPAPDTVVTIPLRRHRKKDGTVFPVEITGRFFIRDGRGVHIAAIRDISGRLASEAALRESEERLRLALQAANQGFYDLDVQTGAAIVSDEYARMLDYDPARFKESNAAWLQRLHPDDVERVTAVFNDYISGKIAEYRVAFRQRTASGQWKWILSCGRIMSRDDRGRPLRMLGTHTDITERKALEDQLVQAQKMESVGRLAGGVAHDFNNMLQTILGFTDLALAETPPQSPIHGHLLQIRKAGERSADLTRQLLAFARKQTVSPKLLDLNDTVAGMLKMLRRLIGEDIELIWKPGPNLWTVAMDPAQVDQILANLAVNARDAISGVGTLTIETGNVLLDPLSCQGRADFVPGRYVVLTVNDNGCGMGQDVLDHLFEPFFTTKEVGKGTGLGLATIYGIVKQNNGLIDVHSQTGKGTTFKMFFPRIEAEILPEPKAEANKPVRGSETVLLVEDDAAILELGTAILEKQGYTVLAAERPDQALTLLQRYEGPVALLITDVVMPEMNGRDLAEKVAVIKPGIKTLYMSGYTADVIAHHGVLEEGVEFLQKPFSLKTLSEKVREVLDH